MSSDNTQKSVPLVLIGGHRSVAISTQEFLKDTPYTVAAVLDVFDAADDHKYSAQNLSAVLHALHPRPRVLVTGTALEHLVPEVRQVWERYVQMLRAEGDDVQVLYVPVSPLVFVLALDGCRDVG